MPRDPQGAGTRTMLDGLPLCSRCGLLAADHVASVTDCAGFVAPTRDAVAQARERVLDAMPNDCREVIAIAERDVDALIAAVRAECAAKVREVPTIGATPSTAQFFADKMREKILAALEAQP